MSPPKVTTGPPAGIRPRMVNLINSHIAALFLTDLNIGNPPMPTGVPGLVDTGQGTMAKVLLTAAAVAKAQVGPHAPAEHGQSAGVSLGFPRCTNRPARLSASCYQAAGRRPPPRCTPGCRRQHRSARVQYVPTVGEHPRVDVGEGSGHGAADGPAQPVRGVRRFGGGGHEIVPRPTRGRFGDVVLLEHGPVVPHGHHVVADRHEVGMAVDVVERLEVVQHVRGTSL